MSTSSPLKLFIIYAREDQPELKALKAHLRSLEKRRDLAVWHDGEILPGADWSKAIKDQLEGADIVLLLISVSFLNSDYIQEEELTKALGRHEKGEVLVVPVIVKHCLWREHDDIKLLQVLPKDGKPVSSWTDADEAWTNIAEGISRLIQNREKSLRLEVIPQNLDPNYRKIKENKKTGGIAFRHPAHKREVDSLISQYLVRLGKEIWLTPAKEYPKVSNVLMNAEEWRFQKIECNNVRYGVQEAIKVGKRHAPNVLCFIDKPYKINEVTFGIYNAVKFDKSHRVKKIAILLLRSNCLIEASREEVLNNSYMKKFFKKTEETT